ncbi:hypothetical protein [Neptunicoccus cionae]|nr:hypothetical protein [Amylibacter cionae]
MKRLLVTLVWFGGAAFAIAQTDHTGHTGHTDGMAHSSDQKSGSNSTALLSEPGQGAFAALSEVVHVLEADPNTDWTKVDLTGLRAHLLDMDRLVTDTIVAETSLANGLHAVATGDADTIAALQRMVPAHAAELARDEHWTIRVDQTDSGVELRVTADDPATIARIKGLGFFGLMASKDHHRAHHLRMALGQDAHKH